MTASRDAFTACVKNSYTEALYRKSTTTEGKPGCIWAIIIVVAYDMHTNSSKVHLKEIIKSAMPIICTLRDTN